MAVTINGTGPVTGVTTLASPTTINGLTLPTDSLQPGMVLITPTSVAGTGVTLSGAVVSFAGSTTVSVNGCFTSTYANYRIVYTSAIAAASQNLVIRLRAAGTDNSGAIYNYGAFYYQSNGVVNVSANTDTSWLVNLLSTTQIASGSLDIVGPQLAAVSTANGLGAGEDTAARGRVWTFGGNHATATAFDGFTMLVGGSSITGSLRVYGYRNS